MTIVKKGANRAGAMAKRARAAQRTPLPPRTAPQKTPTQLAEERAVERAEITAAVRSAPRRNGKPSKPQAFALKAEELGWSVTRVRVPKGALLWPVEMPWSQPPVEGKYVLCTRDIGEGMTEVVLVYWNNRDAFDHEYTDHNIIVNGDRLREQRTIVNAATGYRAIAVHAIEAVADATKAHTRKVRKVRAASGGSHRAPLPFDPATADDDIVLKAVAGKRISWRNTNTEEPETDTVLDNTRQPVTITLSTHNGTYGRRILNFLGQNGFRACFVDQLVRVK